MEMALNVVLEELIDISVTMEDVMVSNVVTGGQIAISAIMEGAVVIMEIMKGKMVSRVTMELMLEMQLGMIGRSRDVGVEVEGEGGEEAVVEEGDLMKVMILEVRVKIL